MLAAFVLYKRKSNGNLSILGFALDGAEDQPIARVQGLLDEPRGHRHGSPGQDSDAVIEMIRSVITRRDFHPDTQFECLGARVCHFGFPTPDPVPDTRAAVIGFP